MSIRRPDLGPAGRAELDEPTNPLGPADRGALVGDDEWPVRTPTKRQPVAGGVKQPLGTGHDDPGHLPGERSRPRDVPPGTEKHRPHAEPGDEHGIGDPGREDDRREVPGGGFDDP